MHALLATALQAFRPPAKPHIIEWVEKHVRLSHASAAPGPIRLNQKQILEAYADPRTHTIVLKFAAQSGKSTILEAITLYNIACTPCPSLIVLPTINSCKSYAKERLTPIIQSTPSVRELISNLRHRGNGQLSKQFEGGSLAVVPAGVPSELAARSIKTLMMDEVDRMPFSSGKEGSPIELAMRRTATFRDRKIILCSSPTAPASPIDEWFMKGTQEQFEVPCPECGTYQSLEFENLTWDKGASETAKYRCEHCGHMMTARERINAIEKGVFVAYGKPQEPGIRSFMLSGLASPWDSFAELAKDSDAADSILKRRVFTNTRLARTWDPSKEEVLLDEHELLQRAVTIDKLPADTRCITIGVDCQGDRLEASTWFHRDGAKRQSGVLSHVKIMGDPTIQRTWDELELYIARQQWPVESSKDLMRVGAVGVDSGFAATNIYQQVARLRQRNIPAVGVKGMRDWGRELLRRSTASAKAGVPLYIVGVYDERLILQKDLSQTDPEADGYVAINTTLDEAWAKGLCAEHVEVKMVRGYPRPTWVAKGNQFGKRIANESSDCAIYARAVSLLVKKSPTSPQNNRPERTLREIAQGLHAIQH